MSLAAENKRRIDRLLQNAADLIAIVDRNWTVMYLSPVVGPLANYARQLGVGAELLSMFDPPAQERAVDLMQLALASEDMTMRDVFRSVEVAESWFEISLIDQSSDRAIGGIIVTLRDITQQKQAIDLAGATLQQSREQARVSEQQEREFTRAQQETRAAEQHALELRTAHEQIRAAEAQASLMAQRDALTGMPNRRVFSTDLQTAIENARNRSRFSSLLLVDLDGFKKINDLYGHQIGDAVLCDIARRMQATLRNNDTIARLGGDEFAIISEGHADMQQHREGAMQLADRLLKTIRQPLIFDDNRIKSGASIGIALCRAEVSASAPLLHAADVALYRAKASGGGRYRFFEQSMDDEMRALEMLEKDLIAAISEAAIQPYFQPVIDLRLNEICGFEALARWDHPKHGFIGPIVFIPIVAWFDAGADGFNSPAVLQGGAAVAGGDLDWGQFVALRVEGSVAAE